MCAGTPGAASDPAQVGLSGGHVYSVLDVRRDVAGLGLDFLKFRDPNSYKLTPGWSGDWSQRSPLWGRHPEVLAASPPDLPRVARKGNWVSLGIGPAPRATRQCLFWPHPRLSRTHLRPQFASAGSGSC